MSAFTVVIAFAVTLTAVSYAWGMRGDLIGGEEGAMLPGAVLGLCLAVFSGCEIIKENFFVFAAVGAAAMFMGGTEPYAQTMAKLYWGEKYINRRDVKKHNLGLGIKGAAWFGIAGGFIGMSYTAATGCYYKAADIPFLLVIAVIMRYLGVRLLNKPLDPEKKVFPRYYFSDTSQEEWGGLWGIMLTMIGFMILRHDFFSLKLIFCGTVSGSVGWLISNFLNAYTLFPQRRNNKYFFGKFQERGKIDNWKIMEFSYGALGSLGILIGFFSSRSILFSYYRVIEFNGGIWSPLSEIFDRFDLSAVLSALWIALIVLDALHHCIKNPSEKFSRLVTLCRRPLFSYSVLCLCLLGAKQAAVFASFSLLLWAGVEEFCFVSLPQEKYKHSGIAVGISVSLTVILSLLPVVTGISYGYKATFIIYCLSYFLETVFLSVIGAKKALPKYLSEHPDAVRTTAFFECLGSSFSVKLHYLFCIVLSSALMFIFA